MLFIEYDVTPDGMIELVALINATEQDGADPDGEVWLQWRRSHEDEGMGCAAVSPEDLALLEATEDPDRLLEIVERIVLVDRRQKEEAA